MSMRWLVAGSFLLTGCVGAFAADPDAISAPGTPVDVRDIPILSGTTPADNSTDHFQVTVNPLIVQRAPDATTGVLADSYDEFVDAGWQIPIFSMFTIGYDTGVNAFRQDQEIWDDEEATSQVTTAFSSKPSLQIQAGPTTKWTGYVQQQRSFTDGVPGYADSTKYGTDVAWTPVKDVTTLKVDASTQETYNFNNSILDEDLYTGSLDQKLPYIPFTLHTAGSLTEDSAPLLVADDKSNTIENASLLWKLDPSTSWTTGVQRQDTTIPATLTLQNTESYFGQLAVQASQSWAVTVGATRELKAATEAGAFLSNGSDVLLNFGLTWKLGDRFNAGAGIGYRVLQSQTPAAAANTPPATVSISAGGNF